MSKRIERYEGRSAEDLNAKNCCAFCGASLGNGHSRIFSNKRLEWFDRESCRTKRNADIEQEFVDSIAQSDGFRAKFLGDLK